MLKRLARDGWICVTGKLIKDLLHDRMQELTPTERQVATALMRDYPVRGLQSITKLAGEAGVSTPTVIRMARKLGFDGFPGLQDALRDELSEQIRQPLAKPGGWQAGAGDGHVVNRFADALSRNLTGTLERLDTGMFDTVAGLLADRDNALFLAGGRITRANADYLYNHLQIIRPGVTSLSRSSNVWPQYLLDMGPGSVLILFDIRRYEKHLQKLAELAQERGCEIVLFTDQWGSPIGTIARHVFHAQVEAPSSWDSTMVIMFLIEALIADVQARRAGDGRDRIEALEAMFSATRLFRDMP